MYAVRPYRVRTALDEKDWLVISFHPYVAASKHLRRIHEMRRKADRHEVIEASPPPRELRPFFVVDEAAAERRAALYALDADEALRMSVRAGFDADEPRLAVGADHLWALAALPDDELVRQATYVWADNSEGGRRHRIAPAAWGRSGMKGERAGLGGMMSPARMNIALALRVAMAVPALGLPNAHHFSPPGTPLHTAEYDRRRELRKIHGANVPLPLVEEMIGRFGAEISPWDPDSTELLAAFAEAYGLDPDEMRWPEIAALWKGGTEAMERARLDGELGMYDWFGYGVRNRISKPR